jgi:REP element-mobilizing transposase RayT
MKSKRRGSQLSFSDDQQTSAAFRDHKKRHEHGGGLRESQRKLARPFDSAKHLHVTLRSSRARGQWSFLRDKNYKIISRLIYLYSARFNVKVVRFANAGNHIHLLLHSRSRQNFQNFLRVLAGMIPRAIANAEKGRAIGKFWDSLAYSKLISWGRQLARTSNYVLRNELEGLGLIPQRKDARGHITLNFAEIFEGY